MSSMINRETTPLLSEGSAISPIGQRDSSSFPFVHSSLRKLIESLSSTEREHALQVMGVGPAASMIKDAVLGYQDAPHEGFYNPYENPDATIRNTISVVCGRFIAYNWVKRLLVAANWLLFILTFVEPPHWCRDSSLDIAKGNYNDSLSAYGDCHLLLNARGTTADGAENKELYPNWNAMFLSVSQSKHIELGCIFVVFFYLIMKMGDDGYKLRLFFYPGYKRWVHSLQITVLLCLASGNMMDNTILNPFFRMILLGSFLRNFQKEFLTMIKMVSYDCGRNSDLYLS